MKGPTPISASSRNRGFTLLELLLVCALIALAAGLVGSALSGNDQKQFSTSLRQISVHLKAARRLAIVSGSEQHVRLATETPDPGLDERVRAGEPDWLNPDMRLSYAATLDDPLEETRDQIVTFFPLGSSTGGLFQVTDQGDREAYIYIAPLTGKMVIESSLSGIEDRLREEPL